MLLIEKGRRPRAICRECAKLHSYRDCPAKAERVREQQRVKRITEEITAYQERVLNGEEKRVV